MDFPVSLHARTHEDSLRTELGRGPRRHGGAHSELPRLVAGRANHPALIGRSADDQRLSLVLGLIALLDGREERIHIDMKDDAGHEGQSKEEEGAARRKFLFNSYFACKSPACFSPQNRFSRPGAHVSPRFGGSSALWD